MAEDYQMLEELGSGSFGTVYRALHKPSGDYVAIKHIDLEGSDDDIQEIQQEISLLATCSSEYVTRYRTSFVRGVKLWIVMEYLGGGSCLDLLKPCPKGMDERYIAVIMRELLHGLDYLHSTGKIHRDIKAANILLSEAGQVKIADFGVAAQLTNIKSQRLTFVGTPFWMAPEVIQEAGYDFRADIWSLGITAMELALGEPPRSDVHPMKVLFLIPKEKPPRLDGNRFSKEFKEFVTLCLNKEAERRPSAKALLKHPFIRKAGQTEMLQELVLRTKEFEQSALAREKDIRYYEETLKGMGVAGDDDDDWVFDTLKPNTMPKPLRLPKHTIKRRKLERIPSDGASEVENATAALELMALDTAPLNDCSLPSMGTPVKEATTIRTPRPRVISSQRRVSAVTSRKISASSPTMNRGIRNVSGATPTARKVSAQQQAQPRQPLGLDMSFGNGASTVRQFKRVSSGIYRPATPTESLSPQDSIFDSDGENKPPRPLSLATGPAAAVSKESILGRRCYTKCLEPAFAESHAVTGEHQKRNALGAVAEAWAHFDEVDPEGSLLLLKSILDRVQSDPKLNAALLPNRVVNAQLASLRTHRDSVGIEANSSPGSGRDGRARSLLSAAATPPSSSPSKPSRYSDLQYLSPTSAVTSSPSKLRESSSSNGLGSPTKLVLNPQNPHLKKMRSSQALRQKEMAALEEKMPGGTKAAPGLEHVGMLADVLYGRWTEGLKARWPLA